MTTSKATALFDSLLNNILMKSAETIANDARANAPTNRIKTNINISPVQDIAGGKQIKISVKLDDAPEARAYELGSGIHGEYGTTYPIDAKNVSNLVFFWEKRQKWFVGPHVDHPGVEARPYLFPAGRKQEQPIRDALLRAVGSTVSVAFEERKR